MGYTGEYSCLVPFCDYGVSCTQDRYVTGEDGLRKLVRGTATAARQAMVAHGRDVHESDWTSVGNETWVVTETVGLTTAGENPED